jgi:hypothetical protein
MKFEVFMAVHMHLFRDGCVLVWQTIPTFLRNLQPLSSKYLIP